jgi:putative peptidoglycan lipid II flippase
MKRVAFDSAVVTALNILGQFASFVLFAGIAALFGADWQTDAFFLAMTIPALFIGAVVNALTSAFIPLLTEYRVHRPDELGRFVGSILLAVTGLGLLATLLIALLAPLLLAASAGGLSDEARRLAYQHTLLLSPMIVVQSVIGVLAAVYNAEQRFAPPATAVVLRYIGTLLLIWLLRPSLGVLSLSAGFVIGTLLNLAVLITFWSRLGVKLTLTHTFDSQLTRALRLALPLIAGTAALQLGIVISRLLAAQLPEGSVSVLDYATRIASAILEILTSGIFLVTLADWSQLVVQGLRDVLRVRLRQTIQMVLFLVTPIVAVLLVLREPLIAFLLQRGAFDAALVTVTANVLGLLLLAIPLDVVGRTYVRLFLVWHETSVLGGLATLRLVTMSVLALILMPALGVFGIALADAIALALVALCLVTLANRRLGNTLDGLWMPIGKLAVASAGSGLAVLVVANGLQQLSTWAMLPLAALAGGLCYLLLSWLLRVQELLQIRQFIAGRQKGE